ncbi:MAG: hypothetical protein C4521_06320 [Actinobacteria bacterium]|nr:MAG: hypothetical protein C4521_06320 [Actinomycetota bacterium]
MDAACQPERIEIHCGYRRSPFSPAQQIFRDTLHFYAFPAPRAAGYVYLDGPWISREEFLERPSGTAVGSSVSFSYTGTRVEALMAPGVAGASAVNVMRDGYQLAERIRGRDLMVPGRFTIAELDGLRVYGLVRDDALGEHELTLETDDPGVRIYSFILTACHDK